MDKNQQKKVNKSSYQSLKSNQQPLISQADQYPNLFKMKVAAIAIITLALIIILVDLGIIIYLAGNQAPPQNISFINDIVTNTNLTIDSNNITFLIKGMVLANSDTKFSHAQKLYGGIRLPNLEEFKEIYRNKSDNMLYLIDCSKDSQAPENATGTLYGIFLHASFPIPSQENIVNNISYYTFEMQEQRKSILADIYFGGLIKQNETMSNPLDCKTYILDMQQQSVTLLNLLKLDLKNNVGQALTRPRDCVQTIIRHPLTSTQFISKNFNFKTKQLNQFQILKYQIYHLY